MSIDAKYMRRCLDIASIPGSKVAPNPLVGCVIVCDDVVIGEGFHTGYGAPHAEVEAIRSVKDRTLLTKSTLYVNLEPCCHHGKTPPCTDLIIESGIPEVVISAKDPNPLVSGDGIRKLKDSGIKVTESVLEKEGRYLNRRFFKYICESTPYVILKWAQSRDHFLSEKDAEGNYIRSAISGPASDILVHKWRSEEQSILVGSNTFRTDRPELTVRHWIGAHPIRVILGSSPPASGTLKYGKPGAQTIVITGVEHKDIQDERVTHLKYSERSVVNILQILYERGISSVLVEGGAKVLNSFIKSGLWDECRIITSDTYIGDGLPAPVLDRDPALEFSAGNDVVQVFFRDQRPE
jgi:diaminohydroxyphosphoribosylaminopyrimidine deaminase/5-amino-6-(5-phosphoribosylamino)uracil reductase